MIMLAPRSKMFLNDKTELQYVLKYSTYKGLNHKIETTELLM